MNREDQDRKATEAILDEAEALTWALLDDRIEDAETVRLSKLIEEHAEVRSRYLDCVRLHVDLHEYFDRASAENEQAPTDQPDRPKGGVMPNLLPGLWPTGGAPQPVE